MTENNLSAKLVCGAIAGVIGTSIIYPLDIVKTRLQNQSKSGQYQGALDCFRKIVSKEGFKGLYRGLAPNLIGIIPEKAIKLAVNDHVRERLTRYHNQHNTNQVDVDTLPVHYGIVAGATAGFCQVVATNPMEIVKIRMQMAALNNQAKMTPFQVVKDLGLLGVYKGTAATLCRDVPFSIVFFPCFALLKQVFRQIDCRLFNRNEANCPFWCVFSAGIFAGMTSAAVVTPMDVVKTRLQVAHKAGDPIYRSMFHCYQHIIVNEGPKNLLKGLVPRMMIVSPLFAITVLVYEFQQRYLM